MRRRSCTTLSWAMYISSSSLHRRRGQHNWYLVPPFEINLQRVDCAAAEDDGTDEIGPLSHHSAVIISQTKRVAPAVKF